MLHMGEFQPVADVYDPLKAGSIDGTDTEPHDHGIVRAMNAKYKPNKGVKGDPLCTVFVGRLNHCSTEGTLSDIFGRYGKIAQVKLIRDLVTGYSKGYAFIEYTEPSSAQRARVDANKRVVDDKEILVEMECERTLKGWVPRRLGGGLSGKRESGQLRFGGRDRPFVKPIIIPQRDAAETSKRWERNDRSPRRQRSRSRSRDQNRRQDYSRDRSRYS